VRVQHIEEAVQLMKMEYAELPALALTSWQAQQLWDLSEELCDRALRFLVNSAFLVRTTEGTYILRDHVPTRQPSRPFRTGPAS